MDQPVTGDERKERRCRTGTERKEERGGEGERRGGCERQRESQAKQKMGRQRTECVCV